METPRSWLVDDLRRRPLKDVLAAYDQVKRAQMNGATLDTMDEVVLEQAPAMAADTAQSYTDIQLSRALADLEKARLEHGAHADPSWQVQANALMTTATDRHPPIENTITSWESNQIGRASCREGEERRRR